MIYVTLIFLFINVQRMFCQIMVHTSTKDTSDETKRVPQAENSQYLKYIQQSNNYNYTDINNILTKENSVTDINNTKSKTGPAEQSPSSNVTDDRSINLKYTTEQNNNLSFITDSLQLRRAIDNFLSNGKGIDHLNKTTEKEERTPRREFSKPIKFKHEKLSQIKLKDELFQDKKEKFKKLLKEKSKHLKMTLRAKELYGVTEATKTREVEDISQKYRRKKEGTEIKSSNNTRQTNKPFVKRAHSNNSMDLLGTLDVDAGSKDMKKLLRTSQDSKKGLPPHEMDMAPAKGPRISHKRLKNQLCHRSVLIPEGPKYDSKGFVYLQPFQKKNNRSYARTHAPNLILPRCCNCCKKSVLGCE